MEEGLVLVLLAVYAFTLVNPKFAPEGGRDRPLTAHRITLGGRKGTLVCGSTVSKLGIEAATAIIATRQGPTSTVRHRESPGPPNARPMERAVGNAVFLDDSEYGGPARVLCQDDMGAWVELRPE